MFVFTGSVVVSPSTTRGEMLKAAAGQWDEGGGETTQLL